MLWTDSGDRCVYHVISRTALDGLPFKNFGKDERVFVIWRFLSAVPLCDGHDRDLFPVGGFFYSGDCIVPPLLHGSYRGTLVPIQNSRCQASVRLVEFIDTEVLILGVILPYFMALGRVLRYMEGEKKGPFPESRTRHT